VLGLAAVDGSRSVMRAAAPFCPPLRVTHRDDCLPEPYRFLPATEGPLSRSVAAITKCNALLPESNWRLWPGYVAVPVDHALDALVVGADPGRC
jgi:hypothetical protein